MKNCESALKSTNRELSSNFTPPKGDILIFVEVSPATSSNIWSLSVEGDAEPQPVVRTEGVDYAGHLSQNGRWLAYYSIEEGPRDVYVQAFPPGSGGKWRTSTEGGRFPRWAQNGEELFYWDPSNRIMAVKVTPDPTFIQGNPIPLPVEPSNPNRSQNWDVTTNGQRFLILQPLEEEESESITQINIVLNWFEELKRLCPTEE